MYKDILFVYLHPLFFSFLFFFFPRQRYRYALPGMYIILYLLFPSRRHAILSSCCQIIHLTSWTPTPLFWDRGIRSTKLQYSVYKTMSRRPQSGEQVKSDCKCFFEEYDQGRQKGVVEHSPCQNPIFNARDRRPMSSPD